MESLKISEGNTHTTSVNSGVTGPKFTKFSHDVARSYGESAVKIDMADHEIILSQRIV